MMNKETNNHLTNKQTRANKQAKQSLWDLPPGHIFNLPRFYPILQHLGLLPWHRSPHGPQQHQQRQPCGCRAAAPARQATLLRPVHGVGATSSAPGPRHAATSLCPQLGTLGRSQPTQPRMVPNTAHVGRGRKGRCAKVHGWWHSCFGYTFDDLWWSFCLAEVQVFFQDNYWYSLLLRWLQKAEAIPRINKSSASNVSCSLWASPCEPAT